MSEVDKAPEVKEPASIEEINAASAIWNKAKKALERAKDSENEARLALVKLAFPNGLAEGTNTFDLAGKWKLKVTGVVNRKVDEAALPAILDRIKKQFDGYDASDLVKWSPELKTGDYKSLLKSHPKIIKLFDNALTIKGTDLSTPQLKIEEAKR